MTNYREILRLNSLGYNNSEIADACDCSRTTVIATLRQADGVGIRYPLPDSISDWDLPQALFPSAPAKAVYQMPDYEKAHRDYQAKRVTLNQLWIECCEACQKSGVLPYQLTQFKKYYREYAVKNSATMHLNHKPGEVLQVDWAGDTSSIIDTDTGEIVPAYLFVAVLPYSGYAYVEAFFSMNQENWIEAHVNAFRFYGGIARIIQCDNLKTGVISHGKNEIMLNKAYNDLAEHYNTAIIPCRVKAPKDKALVERTVGIVTDYILGALRNRQFLSLAELNGAISERLSSLNHKPYQKKDGCRASDFEEEKPFLRPLPERPFELAEWKIATVGPNYHIAVDRQNYSVPYEYIRQKVDVRITRSTIEVFFNGVRICSHPRLYGRANQYSTVEEHMPEKHQQYLQWNGDRFRKWASKIGSSTRTAIDALLSGYKVEQQGYKACMGILKLADKYSPERLENSCFKALTFTPRPSLKNIQAILSSGQDRVEPEAEPTKPSSSQYGFTRGDSYYEGRKEEC